jgi:beta-N-acetylhexosaminidase
VTFSKAIPVCALLALAAALSSCARASDGLAQPTHPSARTGHPGTSPGDGSPAQVTNPPQAGRSRSCPARVFAGMSQSQRVGQLFIVGLTGDGLDPGTARAIRAHHFGSVMFTATSTAGVSGIRSATAAVQSLADTPATAGARFFVAANQEGGEIQALQGAGFQRIPPAVAQGLLPPAVLQRAAMTWGSELRAAGVNLDLAPVMDVVPRATAAQNQPIGVLQRELGHDPATVAEHGVAFIRGMSHAGVATTAKHFPGLGRVRGNTDFTAAVADTVTTPDDPYLGPFQQAIDVGVPFVMVALATYARIDAHHLAVFSPIIMRTMLRARMHFRGVIVSDDLAAAAAVASIPPATRAIDFLAAGGDMITSRLVVAAEAMDEAVLARAGDSTSFRSEVNSAVMRVLAAKQAFGLLPC